MSAQEAEGAANLNPTTEPVNPIQQGHDSSGAVNHSACSFWLATGDYRLKKWTWWEYSSSLFGDKQRCFDPARKDKLVLLGALRGTLCWVRVRSYSCCS